MRVRGRVAMGERDRGARRVGRATDVLRRDIVRRQLAHVATGPLERATGVEVQLGGAGPPELPEQRAAHQVVGEREPVGRVADLVDQSRLDRVLEPGEYRLQVVRRDRLEVGEAELDPEHRGGGDRAGNVDRQRLQAP